MKRRDFLKIGAAAAVVGGGSLLGGRRLAGRRRSRAEEPLVAGGSGAGMGETTVAYVKEPAAINERGDVSGDFVRKMLGRAVCLAVGAAGEEEAWKSLFSWKDVVGLKVNCLAAPDLAPHPELVYAIAEGAAKAGVKPSNVIIFDRRERELKAAGFRLSSGGKDFQCIATDTEGFGYEEEPEMNGEVGSCFSRIVTRKVTALASVAVLKDHDLSGVSLCMKNFYGVIHNPNKYHGNGCDPFIADLLSFPALKGKLRLGVIDCLRVQFDGGPAHVPKSCVVNGGVICGRDVVAVDAVGASVIEDFRKRSGLPPLKDAGREPVSIATAAARGLGVADLSRIKVLG